MLKMLLDKSSRMHNFFNTLVLVFAVKAKKKTNQPNKITWKTILAFLTSMY